MGRIAGHGRGLHAAICAAAKEPSAASGGRFSRTLRICHFMPVMPAEISLRPEPAVAELHGFAASTSDNHFRGSTTDRLRPTPAGSDGRARPEFDATGPVPNRPRRLRRAASIEAHASNACGRIPDPTTRRELSTRTALQFGTRDSVAQLVEHATFNRQVLGSSPSGITPSLVPARDARDRTHS